MQITQHGAPLGYQQIAIDTAQVLTVPAGANFAVIVSEAQALRWRDDGTAPTTTVGMPLATNTELNYPGNLAALQIIGQVSGGKINVSYYRITG